MRGTWCDVTCVQRLALCTSAVMYMMSRDHLVMHIDAASLELMLRLLSLDSAPQSISSDDDFSRIRQRLHDIVQQIGPQTSLSLDDMTVSQSVVCWLILSLSLSMSDAGCIRCCIILHCPRHIHCPQSQQSRKRQ